MSLNSFFQFFVPKEKKFYPLYIQQADYIEKASKLLYRMINETNLQQLEELKKEIKACETGGDDVLHVFYTQLFNTVLTPFEREDVHELAEMMDTFLDRIDDSANIILTRRFTDVDEDLTTMTENIMFAAESLSSICRDLEFMNNNGKSKEISRLCQEIKTIEHDNDELYGSYIHKLFEQNYTLTEIIKRKDFVQVLENTTNSAKYISDKIRSIISKL
jgi:predicted phosphate transport protein (TIGR00153 family)